MAAALLILAGALLGGVVVGILVYGRRQTVTHARMRDVAESASSIVDRLGPVWGSVLADTLGAQRLVLVVEQTHAQARERMEMLLEVLPQSAVRQAIRLNGNARIILANGSRILFTSAGSRGLGLRLSLDRVMLHAAVSQPDLWSLEAACMARAGTVHYLSPVSA